MKNFKCLIDTCQIVFSSQKKMSVHLNIHHFKTGTAEIHCNQCLVRFKERNQEFKIHLKICFVFHFICHICLKKLDQFEKFQKHYLSHKKNKRLLDLKKLKKFIHTEPKGKKIVKRKAEKKSKIQKVILDVPENSPKNPTDASQVTKLTNIKDIPQNEISNANLTNNDQIGTIHDKASYNKKSSKFDSVVDINSPRFGSVIENVGYNGAQIGFVDENFQTNGAQFGTISQISLASELTQGLREDNMTLRIQNQSLQVEMDALKREFNVMAASKYAVEVELQRALLEIANLRRENQELLTMRSNVIKPQLLLASRAVEEIIKKE